MNKLLTASLFSLSLMLTVVSAVDADDTTTKVVTTCKTDQYGGQICGETTETTVVHQPVQAGLGDINPVFLTVALAMGSVTLLHLSKKVSRSYVSQN